MSIGPALSAILCCNANFDSIRNTIRHLAAQTAVQQLELILVCSPAAAATLDWAALDRLPRWRHLIIDHFPYNAVGWAAGIQVAAAPAIVLAEDHSFPAPAWAQTLIDCHRNGHAIIAPAIENGNPATLVSWANFFLTFIEWFRPAGSGPVLRGPGHNTCYDRALLLRTCSDLARELVSESALHDRLSSLGHQPWLAAAAFTSHVNVSRLSALWLHSFLGGRIFGDARSRDWTLLQRLFYAVAFPLVPPLRLYRIYDIVGSTNRSEIPFFRAIPATLSALFLHAFGEAIGYLSGVGNSMFRYQAFESRRLDYVIPEDRAILLTGNEPSLQSSPPTAAP